MISNGSPYSTGCPSEIRIAVTVPARGAGIGFMVFIASMMITVCPALTWEPTATKIVKAGLARRAASGEDFDALDGAFIVMLNDLIQQRPDVVEAWMEGELDSQLFLADLKNAGEVAKMAESQTEQIDKKVLWAALYGSDSAPGSVKLQLDFVINDRVKSLLKDATAFLYSLPKKPAAAEAIREGGVDDSIARKVLEKRGLKSPLGEIKAQPLSAFKD